MAAETIRTNGGTSAETAANDQQTRLKSYQAQIKSTGTCKLGNDLEIYVLLDRLLPTFQTRENHMVFMESLGKLNAAVGWLHVRSLAREYDTEEARLLRIVGIPMRRG